MPVLPDPARRTEEDFVALRTSGAYVLIAPKQRQKNRGHALVLPNRHVVDLDGATPAELQELFGLAARVGVAMREAFGAPGTSVFQNNHAPDQTLHHLHVHVVPRFAGDDFRWSDPASTFVDDATRARQAAELGAALRVGAAGAAGSVETD